jgi:uncharacterized protein YjbI with pentapeptide repeats
MKRSSVFLTGIILGGLLGAMMTLLWNPALMKDPSFLLGGIASLVFVLLAIVSLLIWNRVKEIQGKAYSSGRKYRAAFVMLLAVLSCFVFFWQNALHKERVHLQKNQIEKQQDLVESNRTSGLLFLLGNIQDRMDDELSQNPTRILSDETINRISALSYFFKPYLTVGGDSLSEKKLSPERGYLLLAISHMDLDSGCLHKIWSRTSFEWADLRSAELQGADLKGTNLRSADLQGANLQGANLQETNLRAGNLWGANLSQADLTGADMRRAVLSWAGLNGAILNEANLNSVSMISASLRKVEMNNTRIQWADLSGSFLNESNLVKADLFGTILEKAQLYRANLSQVNLRLANLIDANLKEANLSGVNLSEAKLLRADLTGSELNRVTVFEKDWLTRLNEWRVIGGNDFNQIYQVVDSIVNEKTYLRLEKINTE